MAAGFAAGITEALIIVTPFEVVKIRLQQQRGLTKELLRYKARAAPFHAFPIAPGLDKLVVLLIHCNAAVVQLLSNSYQSTQRSLHCGGPAASWEPSWENLSWDIFARNC